ncbi:MAG: endonuclease/exonuclease/phosphatase family protein [Anaerolineaceae bacterium]
MKKLYLVVFLFFFLTSCSGYPHVNSNLSLRIHDLQGCSHQSPYLGKKVGPIQGIVTWKEDQGFYMQDPLQDSQDCSSEAIFVFTNKYPDVIPGDLVGVSGKVNEFTPDPNQNELTFTEIESTSVTLLNSDNLLPVPTTIGEGGRLPPNLTIEDDHFSIFDPQTDGIDFYESLESMRVEIKTASVVEPQNSFNEVFVIPNELITNNVISLQGALIATDFDPNPERILIHLPPGFNKKLNLGDQFSQQIIGILSYAFGNYELIETNNPQIISKKASINKLTALNNPDALRVASYNVENLNRFDDKRIEVLSTQIVKYLGSPDILILEEIQDDSGSEDDGTTSAQKTLEGIIQSIEDNDGPKYYYVDYPQMNNSSGGAPGANIRTVFLYRTDRGLKLSLDEYSLDNKNISVFNSSRLPIVRRFTFNSQSIYIIGLHLVSNGENSPLFGSIQPIDKPAEEKRVSQVKWVSAYAKNVQRNDPNAIILIGGDFNDTPWSATLSELKGNGFINLGDNIALQERYSIIFQGNAYLFDQILFNTNIDQPIEINSSVVHMNTYLNSKQQNSDHDPFVVDLVIQ